MNVASDNVKDIVEAQARVEVSEHQRYMTTNAFSPLCSQIFDTIHAYNGLLHCRSTLRIYKHLKQRAFSGMHERLFVKN